MTKIKSLEMELSDFAKLTQISNEINGIYKEPFQHSDVEHSFIKASQLSKELGNICKKYSARRLVNEYKRELHNEVEKYENTDKYYIFKDKYDDFRNYVDIELSEIERGRSTYDELINQVNLRKNYF